jgi:hypothetical protein
MSWGTGRCLSNNARLSAVKTRKQPRILHIYFSGLSPSKIVIEGLGTSNLPRTSCTLNPLLPLLRNIHDALDKACIIVADFGIRLMALVLPRAPVNKANLSEGINFTSISVQIHVACCVLDMSLVVF